jgi:hypothetical protein
MVRTCKISRAVHPLVMCKLRVVIPAGFWLEPFVSSETLVCICFSQKCSIWWFVRIPCAIAGARHGDVEHAYLMQGYARNKEQNQKDSRLHRLCAMNAWCFNGENHAPSALQHREIFAARPHGRIWTVQLRLFPLQLRICNMLRGCVHLRRPCNKQDQDPPAMLRQRPSESQWARMRPLRP